MAARAVELLGQAGIAADTDDTRGIDHGVFVPFMLIYPEADVPLIPMSLQKDMHADDHRRIGEALAPLRDEDVLIVGSGMSFHNMRAAMTGTAGPEAARFDAWLSETTEAAPEARGAGLDRWDAAPGARASHPIQAEEHLIPLMVAAGAAGEDIGRKTFGGVLGGTPLSGFTFG